jgi:SHS2 domain-containing protein
MYRWVEHTAELGLEIEAPTEAGVFEEAVAALRELIGGEPDGEEETAHELSVEAGDRPALLAAWIEELVFVAERDDAVPERVEGLELREGGLSATVVARAGRVRHLVKAVTYHELSFERSGHGWRAYAVLDV